MNYIMSLYCILNLILLVRLNQGEQYVQCMRHAVREIRSAYKSLDREPQDTKSLGRSRRRWKDNIKMDLR
jgi:hypothetical protein